MPPSTIRVQIPDYNTFVDFPDNTPQEVISAALSKNFPSKKVQPVDEPSFWKDVVVKTGKDIIEAVKPLTELPSFYEAPINVVRKGLKGESVLGAIKEEITKPVSNVLKIIQPAANVAYAPAVITQEAIKSMVRKARGKEPVSSSGLGDVEKLFKGEERTGIVEDIRSKKFESPFVQGMVESAESFIDPLLGFSFAAQQIAKNIPKGFIGKIPKEMLEDIAKLTSKEEAVAQRLTSFQQAAREKEALSKLADIEIASKLEALKPAKPIKSAEESAQIFQKEIDMLQSSKGRELLRQKLQVEERGRLPGPGLTIEGRPVSAEERLIVKPGEDFLERAQRRVGGAPGITELAGQEPPIIPSPIEIIRPRNIKPEPQLGATPEVPIPKSQLGAIPEVTRLETEYTAGGYGKRGLNAAIEMRKEGGSLAGYDLRSQKEWLGGKEPSEKITLYRATLRGEAIQPGDYVTNNLEYAKQHIQANLGGKGKVTKTEATLDDIFPADGPKEFWYAPKSIEEAQLTDIYNQAKAKPTREGKIGETKLYSGGIDTDKIIELADKAGKKVDDYLRSIGVSSESIAVFMSNVGRTAKEVGEEVVKRESPTGVLPLGATMLPEAKIGIEKGQALGEGQKARSFAVGAASAKDVSLETKGLIAEEIISGGKGAYTPITLKNLEREAQIRVSKDTEKAVQFVKGENPSPEQTATGIELIRKFDSEKNYERATDVALDVARNLTKSGQTIVAAKLMGELSPESVLVVAQRTVQKINENRLFPKWAKEIELSPDTSQKLSELVKSIKETTDPIAKTELSQELQSTLNALRPSGTLRKISTLQTIAQLFNPKTIVTRNPLGNELFYRIERLNKYPATLIDWSLSKLTGADRTITFRTAGQGGYWEGLMQGIKAGFRGVNIKGLETQFDLGKGLAFNPKGNPASKVASFFERSLYATLKGFDYAAYNRGYNQTIGELATLRSIKETGKASKELVGKYFSEIDNNIGNIADQYGKYITFQDDNLISLGLSKIKHALNAGLDFGVGDLVLKYPRTPGALVARGLEYSPVGFLKSAYIAMKPWLKKANPDPREAMLALSRAITGTLGTAGLGYYFADKGIITGPADKDKDVASLQRTQGTYPYKVNLSALKRWAVSLGNSEQAGRQEGDMYYSYDWAQPIAMSVALGATAEQEISKRKTFTKAFKNSIVSVPTVMAEGLKASLETIADQPVLSGLIRAVQGYGVEGLASNIVNIASDIPASFTPTLLNQIKQLTDNRKRLIYDPEFTKYTLNKVINKIPGLSEKLPLSYDTTGYIKDLYQGDSNVPFNVFLNPGFASKFFPLPEEEKAMRVWEETGSTKQFPKVQPHYINIPVLKGMRRDTLRVDLTPEEYSRLQKVVGTTTRKMFAKIPDDIPVEAQELLMVQSLSLAGMYGRHTVLPSIKARLKNDLSKEQITILK